MSLMLDIASQDTVSDNPSQQSGKKPNLAIQFGKQYKFPLLTCPHAHYNDIEP